MATVLSVKNGRVFQTALISHWTSHKPIRTHLGHTSRGTTGAAKGPDSDLNEFGLAESHAYALMSAREARGERILKVGLVVERGKGGGVGGWCL